VGGVIGGLCFLVLLGLIAYFLAQSADDNRGYTAYGTP